MTKIACIVHIVLKVFVAKVNVLFYLNQTVGRESL